MTTSTQPLTGLRALVTGGSRGIGAAIVGQYGRPNDIASAVTYLALPEVSSVTGAT